MYRQSAVEVVGLEESLICQPILKTFVSKCQMLIFDVVTPDSLDGLTNEEGVVMVGLVFPSNQRRWYVICD
jgi:hypothetical protein